MELIFLFATIVAGLGAVYYTLQYIATVYSAKTYPGSIEEIRDRLDGVKSTFNPNKPLIRAAICYAWLIAWFVV